MPTASVREIAPAATGDPSAGPERWLGGSDTARGAGSQATHANDASSAHARSGRDMMMEPVIRVDVRVRMRGFLPDAQPVGQT